MIHERPPDRRRPRPSAEVLVCPVGHLLRVRQYLNVGYGVRKVLRDPVHHEPLHGVRENHEPPVLGPAVIGDAHQRPHDGGPLRLGESIVVVHLIPPRLQVEPRLLGAGRFEPSGKV